MTDLSCSWKFVPLISSIYFVCFPTPCPLATICLFSLYMGLFPFCLLEFTCQENHMVFAFFSLTFFSVGIILSRSIHGATNDKISLFLWLSSILLDFIYTHTHTPSFLYSLSSSVYGHRLLPCIDHYNHSCSEHRDTYIFSSLCFHFLREVIQIWNCWIVQ